MIVGIDEVGRGCWAGPLVAAAVGLDEEINIAELTDSKKLSARKRRELVNIIRATTDVIGVGWVWPKEINQLGLTKSVQLAMRRAVETIDTKNSKIIIDGSINYLPDIEQTGAVIKADVSVQAVSAASVIAKVARDAYMIEISKKYPQYGFESHVGYGTAQHLAALRLHGVLSLHRINYKPIQRLLTEST